jgi:glycosyltransferase involved in cell wall biosynthesis
VCFIIAHAWGTGGTIRSTFTTTQALSGDHEMTILSLVRLRDKSGLPLPEGVRLITVDDQRSGRRRGTVERLLRHVRSVLIPRDDGLSQRCSLWTDILLIRALRRLDADVIVGTRPSLTAVLVALRPRGAKLVGQEHLNLETRPARSHPYLLANYAQLDALVALTERDRVAYADRLPSTAVRSIANAVPDLAPLEPDRQPIILSVGRLSGQKAHARLLEAFAPIAERHPQWQLRICGTGPQEGPLAKRIEELGLAGRAVLLGNVRDIEREYALASVFALSSRYEGFPMVLLEAMSRGVPIVAMDCPTGPGELIEDGRNGLLTPVDDVAALTEGLLRLVEDPELRERLAAAGLETSEEYRVPRIAEQWRDLLIHL